MVSKGLPDLSLYCNGQETFEIRNEGAGLITIMCDGSEIMSLDNIRCGLVGTWYYKGAEIVTKDDIERLQSQINTLKGI